MTGDFLRQFLVTADTMLFDISELFGIFYQCCWNIYISLFFSNGSSVLNIFGYI